MIAAERDALESKKRRHREAAAAEKLAARVRFCFAFARFLFCAASGARVVSLHGAGGVLVTRASFLSDPIVLSCRLGATSRRRRS